MARSRLVRIAALTTFFVPTFSYALGVGSLETESALNEPLEARIPLESADLEEIETLNASLAPPEAFERAGLERPFMLSRLEFEVVADDDDPYVLIRTSDPIREPFLAFLVELNWSGGRLIREYTMLLDPPVHSPEEETAPAVAEDAPAPDEPAPDADAPATASPGDPGDPEGVAEETADEIEVGDNDTLWEIAEEARPDQDISVHQMMMALLEANPEAFSDGNVNNLRSGAILRVPERADAEVLTAGEARQQFSEQVEAWQAGRAPDPEPAEEEPEVAEETAEPDDGRLEVVAAGETAGDDATASLMDEDLEASPETVARLQAEIASMREEEASLRSENEELRQQTAELMERMEALERTVDLEVQDALPGLTDEPAEEDIPLADAVEDEPAEELPALFDEDSALEQDLAALDEEIAADEAEPVEETVAEEEAAVEDEAVEDDEPAPIAADEPAAPQAPWEDPRLMSMAGGAAALLALLALLMIRRRRNAAEDASEMVATPAAAGAAGGAATVPLDGADDVTAEDEARVDDPDAVEPQPREGVDPLEEIEVYLAYGRYDQAGDLLSSAIAKEPERTDLRLKQLEVHALTHDRAAFEADAQELYGLVDGADDPVWQQVRDMGREIAPENPLFAAAGAAAAAPTQEPASDATSELMPDEDAELTVPEPAADEDETPLAADSPVTPPAQAAPEESTDEDDFGDLDFSLDDDEAEPAGEAAEEPEAPKPAADDSSESADEDDAFSLEFDLDDFQAPAEAGETPQESDTRSAQGDEDSAEDDDLALDFEAWERPEEAAGGDAPETAEASSDGESGEDDEDDALSFDLDDLDLGEDKPDEEEQGLRYEGPGTADADQETVPSLTDDDTEGDAEVADEEATDPGIAGLAGAAADSGGAADQDDDADDDLFDAGDENSTKLDLARAYLDMGDSEGARSLLDEVIAEGSEDQKQEARSLYEEA